MARVVSKPDYESIDRHLPEWARRSNPIVRRHLGAYWKTIVPDGWMIARLYLAQVALIVVSLPLPFLFSLLMPTVTVSLVLLPATFIYYAQALASVGVMAASLVADERSNGTLPLLLATPRSPAHILYSKIAAAIWRQVDNLGLIVIVVSVASLPVLVIQYDIFFSIAEQPGLMRIGVLLALGTSILRMALEPVMMGALGALVGASTRYRVSAWIGMGALGGAYFLLINLLRLLPLDPAGRLLVEIAVPVVLPILITLAALRLGAFLIARDG